MCTLGKAVSLKAGYRGDSNCFTDYSVVNDGKINTNFNLTLQYKRKVKCSLYAYGSEI
jgi:hypothetical protein